MKISIYESSHSTLHHGIIVTQNNNYSTHLTTNIIIITIKKFPINKFHINNVVYRSNYVLHVFFYFLIKEEISRQNELKSLLGAW